MSVALFLCWLVSGSAAVVQLPNTAGIDGELTAKLGVDHFFGLWIVFNNDDVIMSDKQFTILAPRNNASLQISADRLRSHPDSIKRLLLDHVVLGQRLDLGIGADLRVTTLGGRTLNIKYKQGSLVANGAKVQEDKVDVENGRLIILDNYLFPEDMIGDHSFLQDMYEVLSYLQSGVRVFQHLLGRTNVTKLLKQDDDYTVLVPTDHAFQRWHPIDWGFYPFSVPEFTDSILTNHFIYGNVRQENMGTTPIVVKTLGNREITFQKTAAGTVYANGVEVVGGDTPLSRGNIMLVTEVLFVDEGVVHKLHEGHRDKETPPLLAFPWFGAQFLSHAFLLLESDRRFTHITRFLNVADLVPHIPGQGYTFFVPMDSAFKSLNLESAPDNLLSSKEGLEILLSHFVKGRLYDKDIKDNSTFTSLSGRTLHISRKTGTNGTIEDANIVEKEIFVYNLGTMFYIDKVIFGSEITIPPEGTFPTTTVESELNGESGTFPDILLEDNTSTTQAQETTYMPTTTMLPETTPV
ncbi:transforming growth factor-beta-induced protein ig-h3 isoform X1 [Halyomorpha halys]|uniref:transforming growth factor-beta-induced protein ig-h3 isoform X1 n=1 Tax=Halyomorpha halys TaxID=286706 RepID=UPI0006D521F8|nr:transforming growth factor-beta-induced protein ig-h3 isoform X1 [Halyomorpha halys]